jgi:hypothetical protein
MIGATRSVLVACTGSAQSLSRSLSPVDRVRAETSPATRRRWLFSRWKPLTHLPTCQFPRPIRHREPQKAIQYPEARSGSVQ